MRGKILRPRSSWEVSFGMAGAPTWKKAQVLAQSGQCRVTFNYVVLEDEYVPNPKYLHRENMIIWADDDTSLLLLVYNLFKGHNS